MPTVLTHALLPLIAAAGLSANLPGRLVVAGMAVAMLPDADVVSGMAFGIPHTHDLGHRGASHTILFSLCVGLFGAFRARALQTSAKKAFLFLLFSTLSHPLTDMATEGGKGIMLWWPFEDLRFKLLFNPVEVSPIGLKGFETGRIWSVLWSEARWLIFPAALLAFFARLVVNFPLQRPTAD